MNVRVALVLIFVIPGIGATVAVGDVCTTASTTISLDAPRPWDASPPLPIDVGLLEPWWLYTLEGGPFEFDVRLTLEKFEDDGGPPCVFPVGSRIWATIEVTNLSDQRYLSCLGSHGKFWEIYFYEAVSGSLELRFSNGQPYTDSCYYADIDPGETLTELRFWRPDGIQHPYLPPGVYRAVGRFEPSNGWRPRGLTRSDTTLAPGLTVSFVD